MIDFRDVKARLAARRGQALSAGVDADIAALVAEVERLRGDAANWRAVRDEVLRLDDRPGTMADDDVLSVVGAVLQRAAKKSGEHRREETK
jgi:hypothetical protein